MGTILIVTVVVLFLILSVVVGLAASWKWQDISEDYFLAGRTLPWYAVALSIAGTGFRLEFWLAMIGLAHALGLAAASLAWGNFFATSVLLWVFLPFFYRKKLYSAVEFLERRYSSASRAVFALLAMAALVLGVLVPALYVGGWVLCEAGLGQAVEGFSWELAACIAVVALAAGAYAVYGGLTAGVWTSALGLVAVAAGGALLAVVATRDAGGLAAVIQRNAPARLVLLLPTHNAQLPWTGVVALWFTVAVWHVGASPVVVQRCLGARSEWDAKMGVIGAGFLQLAIAAVIVLPGLAAFAKLGAASTSPATWDHAAIGMIEGLLGRATLLGALGQGLVVAAVLAAVMSAVSGVLNAVSGIWTMDVCQELLQRNVSETELVRRGRWSSFVILVLGTVLTPLLFAWERSILDYVLEVAAVIGPPVAVVFLVAFFWPRAHGRAATATLIVGALAGILLWVVAEAGQEVPSWLAPALNRAGLSGLFSLVFFGLATFAIPQNPRELYDPNTTWNLQWSRLPPHERASGSGPRSLVFWWLVMIAATLAAWVVFR